MLIVGMEDTTFRYLYMQPQKLGPRYGGLDPRSIVFAHASCYSIRISEMKKRTANKPGCSPDIAPLRSPLIKKIPNAQLGFDGFEIEGDTQRLQHRGMFECQNDQLAVHVLI